MRRLAVIVTSVLMLGGTTVAGTLAQAAHRGDATHIIIVRPVNASGHAEPGFAITPPPDLIRFPIDCSYPEPAPAAVSPNIEWCTPTVASALACWKAAAAHKTLCMQGPRSHKLVRFARRGRFAPTDLAPAQQRAPLAMVLGDGDYCSMRSGGAWTSPPGHPRLVGYYVCRHDGAVWARAGAAHQGIDESQPTWTVRTAHFTSRHLVTHRVVRAWFVGTAGH